MDSCKNFFGQMTKSDVRAFQSPYRVSVKCRPDGGGWRMADGG